MVRQTEMLTGDLARFRLFDGLTEAELAAVAAECSVREVDPGTVLIGHLDSSREVYFVLTGEVRVTIFSFSGREVAYRTMNAGDYFGELAAIDGGARSTSIIAQTPAKVAVMQPEAFRLAISRYATMGLHLLEDMAARVRDLTERVLQLTTMTARDRLLIELLRLAKTDGMEVGRKRISGFPTHSDLASSIGSQREVVSRELGKLTDEGLVRREDRDLIIVDPEELERRIGAIAGTS